MSRVLTTTWYKLGATSALAKHLIACDRGLLHSESKILQAEYHDSILPQLELPLM